MGILQFSSQMLLPVVYNSFLDKFLKPFFWQRGAKQVQWLPKLVLLIKPKYLGKPRSGWRSRTQGSLCNGEEYAVWKPRDHSKESQLSNVEKSFPRHASSQEVDHCSWSARIKSLEIAKHFLMMLVNHRKLGFLQDKCRQTREQDWDSKDTISMETCSWIATMSTGYPSMEYCTKSPVMCGELFQNCGEVSGGGAQYSSA